MDDGHTSRMIFRMTARITISLTDDISAEVDQSMKLAGLKSRSAFFERAARELVARLRGAQIDAELDAYYASQTAPERAEERAMVEAVGRTIRGGDIDGPTKDRPRRGRRGARGERR